MIARMLKNAVKMIFPKAGDVINGIFDNPRQFAAQNAHQITPEAQKQLLKLREKHPLQEGEEDFFIGIIVRDSNSHVIPMTAGKNEQGEIIINRIFTDKTKDINQLLSGLASLIPEGDIETLLELAKQQIEKQ